MILDPGKFLWEQHAFSCNEQADLFVIERCDQYTQRAVPKQTLTKLK